MNGIVSVSKKNTVLIVFADMEPSTSNVFVTWTFVVVTEFETTRFAKGCVIALLEMLLKRPPSP